MKHVLKIALLSFTLLLFNCEDEPIDNTTIEAEDPIIVDTELYNNIERVTSPEPEENLVCLEFDYAFALFVFDETLEFVGLEIIGSDIDFSSLLGSLQEGYAISISYPITYTTEEGETIEITNNDQLKDIIDVCIDIEAIEDCSGLLTEEDCIWRVINNPDGNNDFEGATFDVSEVGITSFNNQGDLYFGTWVVFTIEHELHTNINFDDDGEVATIWNKDWKTTILDDENMMLESGDLTFFIQKECNPGECNQFIFEECETNEGEGFAQFDLVSYIPCFTSGIDISNATLTFHETLVDMENGVNALTSPYTNTTSPQFIYVRIEDSSTGDASFISIQIAAVSCED